MNFEYVQLFDVLMFGLYAFGSGCLFAFVMGRVVTKRKQKRAIYRRVRWSTGATRYTPQKEKSK